MALINGEGFSEYESHAVAAQGSFPLKLLFHYTRRFSEHQALSWRPQIIHLFLRPAALYSEGD